MYSFSVIKHCVVQDVLIFKEQEAVLYWVLYHITFDMRVFKPPKEDGEFNNAQRERWRALASAQTFNHTHTREALGTCEAEGK